jgi:hypothetical protein
MDLSLSSTDELEETKRLAIKLFKGYNTNFANDVYLYPAVCCMTVRISVCVEAMWLYNNCNVISPISEDDELKHIRACIWISSLLNEESYMPMKKLTNKKDSITTNDLLGVITNISVALEGRLMYPSPEVFLNIYRSKNIVPMNHSIMSLATTIIRIVTVFNITYCYYSFRICEAALYLAYLLLDVKLPDTLRVIESRNLAILLHKSIRSLDSSEYLQEIISSLPDITKIALSDIDYSDWTMPSYDPLPNQEHKSIRTIEKAIKLDNIIAKGCYGSVYKITSDSGKNIAIKKQDNQYNTALIEIAAMCTLSNPHIERIKSFSFDTETIYTGMSLRSGTLKELIYGKVSVNHYTMYKKTWINGKIKTKTLLDMRNRRNIAMQLLEGLKYLRLNGVIHRDIKPDNILYCNNGKIKIADFGLCSLHCTTTGKFLSPTSAYALWWRDIRLLLNYQYSFESDIWATGIILLEMETGANPLGGVINIPEAIVRIEQLFGSYDSSFNVTKGIEFIPDTKFATICKKMLDYRVNTRLTPQDVINELCSLDTK